MLKRLWNSFCDLCWPPSCFHCQENAIHRDHLLCESCAQQMEMLDLDYRCKRCFSIKDPALPCFECLQSRSPFCAIASVFDYEGPASTLVKQLKYGHYAFLAEAMGAYLTLQAMKLNWPIPDYIIPTPLSALKLLSRGFNQSEQLAISMTKSLKSEVFLALGRCSGDYSQAGLSRDHRMLLNKKSFVLLDAQKIQNKIIYLIDDVLTTGQTLQVCGEVLQQASPKAIYGLTFCKAR